MSSCSLQTTDKMLTVNQNLSHFDGWQCSKASNEGSRRRSVLNVKVLVGAFNQEKALCRGLLCEYRPSCGPSFAGLMLSVICCGWGHWWPDDRALPGTLAQLQTGEDGDIWNENKTENCGAPHLASLPVSASPHWQHPGAFNLITEVMLLSLALWSPSHPWRIIRVISTFLWKNSERNSGILLWAKIGKNSGVYLFPPWWLL